MVEEEIVFITFFLLIMFMDISTCIGLTELKNNIFDLPGK